MKETLEEAKERYLDSPLPHSYKLAVEFGAKWQQENSYSEEEVLQILQNIFDVYGKHIEVVFIKDLINDLFQQYKKK